MNNGEKVFLIGIALAMVAFIWLAIWSGVEQDKKREIRMSECFERVDDPRWCYKNIR